jgi:hypothetical protein
MKKRFVLIFTIFINLFVLTVTVNAATPEEVYQHNLNIYDSQLTDPAALEFYKLPSKDGSIKSDADEIIELADSITQNISGDYAKTKAIHDWAANNIYYDRDALNDMNYENTDALSVLKTKRSMCAGYANLTVALLRAAGIPAKYVDGFSLVVDGKYLTDEFYDLSNNKINHAWCEAFVDGRWNIIDITWDSKNVYENGTYTKSPCEDKYFDISLKDISANHKYRNYSFDFREFDLSGLTSITIPDSITNIKVYEFADCVNLKSIIIHDGVINIGIAAFQNCTSLTDITIPDSVRIIDNGARYNCINLTNITMPENIKWVTDLFEYYIEADENIDIDIDEIKYIGSSAFKNCVSLTNIKLPDGIIVIEKSIFENCVSLTDITIPDSVQFIRDTVFEGCDLNNLTIYGEAGSYAKKYAEDNGIKFVALNLPLPDEIPTTLEVSEISEVTVSIEEVEGSFGGIRWLLIICPIVGLIPVGVIIGKNRRCSLL